MTMCKEIVKNRMLKLKIQIKENYENLVRAYNVDWRKNTKTRKFPWCYCIEQTIWKRKYKNSTTNWQSSYIFQA